MVSPAFSPRSDAMRWAMLLAARRRGSSMTIFLPCSQGSSSRARGRTVLFPAPGGVLIMRVFCSFNNCRTRGMVSAMGRSTVEGSKRTVIVSKDSKRIYLQMSKSQPLHSVVFRDTRLATLSESHVLAAAERGVWISSRVVDAVTPIGLAIDAGTFSCLLADGSETTVCVEEESGQLHVSSGRPGPEGRLTWAEATVLIALLRRQELGVFFLPAVRYQKLQQAAAAYGLECEPNLDRYLVPTF